MGKNQAYKAMQRARLGSSSGGPDEVDDGMVRPFSHYSLIILFELSRSFFVLNFYLVVK